MASKNKKQSNPENPFSRMHRIFSNNIFLHEVSIDSIGPHALKYDKSIINKIAKTIEGSIPKGFKNKKKRGVTLSETVSSAVLQLLEKQPRQERLFLRNTLVSIVSALDFLFIKIFEYYYKNYPDKLLLNKNISYNELKTIDSVEEAQNILIQREIETIFLQQGLRDRLKILKDEFNIEIPGGENNILSLRKLIKIRNLIVHNECRADNEYAKEFGDGKKKDDLIEINKEYLTSSLALVYFVGSFILQELQIKLSQNFKSDEDSFLNDVIHNLIKRGRYELARPFYDYALLKKLDERSNKMIVINYCIALKKQGKNKDHIEKVLQQHDWSLASKNSDFKLALAGLREEDTFFKFLETAIRNRNIGKEEMLDWEIFSFYRKKQKFKELLKQAA